MESTTKSNDSPKQLNIAVYLRLPKLPKDESAVEMRINRLLDAAKQIDGWSHSYVYTDVGIPGSNGIVYPGFDCLRKDFMDGKIDAVMTEPPHQTYRELDQGMDYLLELREIGADIHFSNGQTMPELLAISIFRSTMKALSLVEAMAVQEMEAVCDEDEDEVEQPTMQL